jgi:hypothetical protein
MVAGALWSYNESEHDVGVDMVEQTIHITESWK